MNKKINSDNIERSILSLLISFGFDKLENDIGEKIHSYYFYNNKHIELFEILNNINNNSGNLDLVLVFDYIDKNNTSISKQFILDLIDTIYSIGSIKQYFEELKNYYINRILITYGDKISGLGFKGYDSSELSSLLNEFNNTINGLSSLNDIKSFKDISYDYLDNILYYKENKDKLLETIYFSGYKSLDNIIGGFNKTELIVLAGQSGYGKTMLSLNLANNFISNNYKVLFISLEMSTKELLDRLISIDTRINGFKIKHSDINDSQYQTIIKSCEKLSNNDNLFLDDSFNLKPSDLKQKIYSTKKEGIDIVIVDYIQIMSSDKDYKGSETLRLSEITRELKKIAKEFNVVIIALSQLSRMSKTRVDKTPILSDLRGSGTIENDANIVLAISKDDAIDDEFDIIDKKTSGYDNFYINVLKSRNSGIGVAKLKVNTKLQRIYE